MTTNTWPNELRNSSVSLAHLFLRYISQQQISVPMVESASKTRYKIMKIILNITRASFYFKLLQPAKSSQLIRFLQ